MADSRWFSRPAAQRLRDEFLAEALPAVFAGAVRVALPDGETQERPFVQLDVTARADIAAAFQVVHVLGLEQEQRDRPYRYVFVDGHGYLEATLPLPALPPGACRFVLVWPDQQVVFDLLQQGQPLMVTTKDLQPPFDWRDAIGLRAGPELAGVLDEWRSLRDDGL